MNLLKISASYLRQRKLNTLLNVLLLALGIATIVVLLLFSKQFEENLTRNAEGIDLVVGAKGSPLQLILSSIYQMDAPTGNIPMADAEQIMQNRAVGKAIPLALGDSYNGYRIVGTSHDYPSHFGVEVAHGGLWSAEREVVLGSRVAAEAGLAVGDEVVSAHGLGGGGTAHGEVPLRVVGVLEPSGTVVDRVVLTSVETVWAVHGLHGEAEEAHREEGVRDAEEEAQPVARPMPGMPGAGRAPRPELTALLVQYSSPMAAALFPRFVNSQSSLQAASPAFETARLFNLLGIGVDALRAFGFILIVTAALGVFIALYNALKERKYDLAIMRTLGASRAKLLWHVLLEGVLLAVMGLVAGLILGHTAAEVLGSQFVQTRQMAMTGWTWASGEGGLVLLAVGVGFVSALIPAIQAYRTDIARTLAQG